MSGICALLAFLIFSVTFSYETIAGEQRGTSPTCASFRDIPGVTQHEIKAIEALREQTNAFVYGTLPSAEAFEQDGAILGFTPLFCDWLTKLFGIPFKPALYDWVTLRTGLEHGEIDFTGELAATDERLTRYIMTGPIAERTIKQVRIADSMPIRDIAVVRSPRYAFLSGATTAGQVSALAPFLFDSIFVDSTELAYAMLKSGQVDAFFDEGNAEAAFDRYDDVVAAPFFPVISVPVSLSTQKSSLAPIISVVQKALQHGAAQHLSGLYKHGQQEYLKHKLFIRLTEEERAYLRSRPVIPIAAEHYNYPISFYNKHEKQWQGIFFDVLQAMEKLAGLSFKLVNDRHTEWPTLLKMLENGEAAMIAELIPSDNRKGRFLWPKTPSLTDYYALLSKSDTPNISLDEVMNTRVGLPRDTAYAAMFRAWFPNHANTVEYESSEDTFRALARGEVSMVMSSQRRLLALVNYHELLDYKANLVFPHASESLIGFNKDQALLCSIFDKALRLIDVKGIAWQWVHRAYDYGAKLARERQLWLIGALVLLLSVLLLLFVLFQRKSSEGKELEDKVQKRTAELRHTLAKLETVISNYKGIIWSVDGNGIITTFNGRYVKAIGLKPSFLEGRSINLPRFKNKYPDVINLVEKTFRDGPQDWVTEIDGVVFHSSTTAMRDSRGNVIGVVGSTDDVTETAKLQRDLENALEAAQVASQAKSAFLANMSHEIRTPMNAIIGMTNIGKSAADKERIMYCLTRIEDASTHLLGVINDILDMSKIEANKFELSPTEFHFERMLQRVTHVIAFRADEKQQRFKIYIDRAVPEYLIGDDQRLAQIITNLAGNAVKVTPEGGAIRIGTYFLGEEDGVCAIKITVTDTGIGMNLEQQARLFQAFQQAESSTTRKFGGTGLGLTISKSIVEMMGGKIWVESELGKGSTFAFTVQVKRGEEKGRRFAARGVHGGNVRILVVDDDPDTLAFLSKIMNEFSIFCDTAESGEEALELVESKGTYDIYFIDWKLPGMDGLRLATAIKEKELDPHNVSVVLFSAASKITAEGVTEKTGVDKFLSKPLFPCTILDTIYDCLGMDHGESQAEPSEFTSLFPGCRILLAEDVEINREIVLTLLEPMQLKIDCAENGVEAVRMFSAAPEKYDMIFMDLQMPAMDGYEAARSIRALDVPQAKTIPIVAMTANVFREDVEQCLAVGMNGHVGKPINLDEVLEKLRTYLPRSSGQ
ncbi:MAG: response regulator [Deltaproteobacteria bacterium]|jgi:PAS domain S-box-containing protein|nr:response regulator [Deltaproteobacteria bacterium]